MKIEILDFGIEHIQETHNLKNIIATCNSVLKNIVNFAFELDIKKNGHLNIQKQNKKI